MGGHQLDRAVAAAYISPQAIAGTRDQSSFISLKSSIDFATKNFYMKMEYFHA